jgi:DNA-binding Lrp family transcriptional regulator
VTILAYVLFKVSSGTEREVCEKLVNFGEVIHADITFGEYDVIARINTENLETLEDFVAKKIRTVPSTLVTSTMLISKEFPGKAYKSKSKNPKYTQRTT